VKTPSSPKTGKRFAVYVLGFILTLHTVLPAYIESSYLNQILQVDYGQSSEKIIGLLFAAAALVGMVFLPLVTAAIRKAGNFLASSAILCLETVSLIPLIGGLDSFPLAVIIGSFILRFAGIFWLGFTIDIFLENYSSDANTGNIRGMFLTSANAAWLVGPMLLSLAFLNSDYWRIYAVAVVLFIPTILLMRGSLADFKDPIYKKQSMRQTIAVIRSDSNIKNIVKASFLLQFFYSVMVIYTPFYLLQHIGFSWSEIGLIFTIMLLPFVIFQLPAGLLADKKFGEKEILSLGFVIMAVSTGLLTFIESQSFLAWASILFISRIGAALVEVMTETYFFKKINASQTGLLGNFRSVRPLSTIVAPVIATAFLFMFDIKYIFALLGILMFFGLRYSLAIKDSR